MLTMIAFLAAATQPLTYREKVTKVVDGDTLEIAAPWSPYPGLKWKVRVLGIDTPEKGSRAKCPEERQRADRATALTRKLVLMSGNQVTLTDIKHDKYGGRMVAKVKLRDGSILGDKLITEGLARPYDGGRKSSWCF